MEETEVLAILNAYPNPTGGRLDFTFSADVDKPVLLTVYDLVGRQVFAAQFVALAGENMSTVNLEELTPGRYILTLSDFVAKTSIRVMKE